MGREKHAGTPSSQPREELQMYKATVLYGPPSCPEDFERHYADVHIPLARKIAGITHWTITKCDLLPDGLAPPFYLIAELYASNRDDLLLAFGSPEGRASASDVADFADGGVQFLFGDETVVTTTPAFPPLR
jgi:uncharacterized protein (TIGR02118 family)